MSSSEYSPPSPGAGAQVKDAARAAKEKVQESATQAREAAADFAREQRDEAAARLHGVGQSLHEAADSTRPEDPNVAWLTDQAAQRLQQAAEYVRTSSWSRLREDGAALARRHPLVFFSGMFALGAVAGAVVKAGAAAVQHDSSPDSSDADEQGEFASVLADPAVSSRPETYQP